MNFVNISEKKVLYCTILILLYICTRYLDDNKGSWMINNFIDAISDRGTPRTLDEALLIACELEAFRLVELDSTKKDAPRNLWQM